MSLMLQLVEIRCEYVHASASQLQQSRSIKYKSN